MIGDADELGFLFSGGIKLDVDYSPTFLYELAMKMDGAIVLSSNATKLVHVNVQLTPDPTILTTETGTRHRTAERVSKQTDAMVVAVSERREVVSLYIDGIKYILEDIPVVLAKANQALATLDKYRQPPGSRCRPSLDGAGVRGRGDPARRPHRAAASRGTGDADGRRDRALHRRGLGTEGRLIEMQLDETMVGVAADKAALVHDYLVEDSTDDSFAVGARPTAYVWRIQDLLDFGQVWPSCLATTASSTRLDYPSSPRGIRIFGAG